MRVVIATDGHPTSTHAIEEAIRLLPLRDAKVFLVSVLDPEQRIGGNEDAHSDIEQGTAILRDRGIEVTPIKRRGHFAEEIVAEATEVGADMIVVGSSGHGRFLQLIGGSVSTEVIHQWKGAVLVVRHP